MKTSIWIGLMAALVAAGCSRPAAEGPAGPSRPGARRARGPVAVRTAFVDVRDIAETLLFTGELESPLKVELYPRVQGRLEKLAGPDGQPVIEGTEVRRGDALAEIDRRELEARLALAEAQVRQAEVAVADRERERRRLEALFTEGVTTEQARDAAVTAHETAQASLAQAQAQQSLAQVNLDEATLVAPMDGVVAARYADPGAMVGPGAPVLRIVQMDPLRLMVALPARLLPMLEEGRTPVTVTTEVLPGHEFECTLTRIFPTVDPMTRTVRAEVLLPNPRENGGWLLRPGMFASARLVLATSPGARVVPASAVIRVLDRRVVFVADKSTVRAATVELGLRDGADIEILSGLEAGDEYVIMGQNKLTDGASIERVGAFGAPLPEEAQ